MRKQNDAMVFVFGFMAVVLGIAMVVTYWDTIVLFTLSFLLFLGLAAVVYFIARQLLR